MNTITIYFDMDGTIADLYGYVNWLSELRAENPHPYAIAKPLVRFALLARKLNALQRNGYRIGIISWGSKTATPEYDKAVFETKAEWLHRHLPSVKWDELNFAPYGTPKSNYAHTAEDILFDDELPNRENWIGRAFDANDIINVLKTL
jgi:5'(3')-deoxyribonucleotidase